MELRVPKSQSLDLNHVKDVLQKCPVFNVVLALSRPTQLSVSSNYTRDLRS